MSQRRTMMAKRHWTRLHDWPTPARSGREHSSISVSHFFLHLQSLLLKSQYILKDLSIWVERFKHILLKITPEKETVFSTILLSFTKLAPLVFNVSFFGFIWVLYSRFCIWYFNYLCWTPQFHLYVELHLKKLALSPFITQTSVSPLLCHVTWMGVRFWGEL